MKGMELCRAFWEEVGLPAFRDRCPEVLETAVVGLVGEGSECFGFDDEISRDHDWGPGFCVWLTEEEMQAFGAKAAQVYRELPETFRGFRRLRQTAETASRVGVMTSGQFYGRYLGRTTPPVTIADWRRMPKNGLAVVTNGQLFQTREGEFTAFRSALLAFYPEDLRRKKLAKECALAAQQGQYNYLRCLRHGERVSALIALGQFIQSVQQICCLLARQYIPYYKWSQRMLYRLPAPGPDIAPLLERLAAGEGDAVLLIEEVCAKLIAELHRQGLSHARDSFLLPHAAEIQATITDGGLRSLPVMAE